MLGEEDKVHLEEQIVESNEIVALDTFAKHHRRAHSPSSLSRLGDVVLTVFKVYTLWQS